MKANQVDVRYHFQKGRIHASLCENTERDCVDDVMVMSSKKGLSVLRGVKSGDKLRARVVKVKARQITGWVIHSMDSNFQDTLDSADSMG